MDGKYIQDVMNVTEGAEGAALVELIETNREASRALADIEWCASQYGMATDESKADLRERMAHDAATIEELSGGAVSFQTAWKAGIDLAMTVDLNPERRQRVGCGVIIR